MGKKLNENGMIGKEVYLKNENFKEIQNKHYKEKKNCLKDKECIIIMDLKQNFVLGKDTIETNHDFYKKNMYHV